MPRQSQRIRKQRNRQKEVVDEESSDSEVEDTTRKRRAPAKNPWIELSDAEQDKYAKRLIRYFLARNYLKMPVKRNELGKALLDNVEGRIHPKISQGAFEKTVAYLKGKFGFQIMEVRKMTKASASQRSQKTQSLTQSQGLGPVGDKGYIIVNMVPESLRAEIKDVGEVTMFGFIIVIAAMILLEPGAKLSQNKLYKNLNCLGLIMSGRPEDNHKDLGNLKEVLEKTLTAQWYFEREKEGHEAYNYLLGPRLLEELTEQHLLAFISAVYQAPLDEATRSELRMRFASMREPSDSESD